MVEVGGLHVILTEFHESARIDRQLFGRCARQGKPGSVEAIVSVDDELFRRFVGPRMKHCAQTLVRIVPDPGVLWWVGVWLRLCAQRYSERTYAKMRRETVEQDVRLEQYLAFAGKAE